MKCYVGIYEDRQIGIPLQTSLFNLIHPRDFKNHFNKIKCAQINIWTNNPYIVDLFDAKDIIVYIRDKNGVYYENTLDQYRDYESYMKNEFDNGEIWSFIGEEWVFTPKKGYYEW